MHLGPIKCTECWEMCLIIARESTNKMHLTPPSQKPFYWDNTKWERQREGSILVLATTALKCKSVFNVTSCKTHCVSHNTIQRQAGHSCNTNTNTIQSITNTNCQQTYNTKLVPAATQIQIQSITNTNWQQTYNTKLVTAAISEWRRQVNIGVVS